MAIKEATRDDADSIRRVAEASWETDYPDVLSRESLAEGIDNWYSADRIRESVVWSRSYMLVEERDDEVVGVVHAAHGREDDVGHVLRLYIHSE